MTKEFRIHKSGQSHSLAYNSGANAASTKAAGLGFRGPRNRNAAGKSAKTVSEKDLLLRDILRAIVKNSRDEALKLLDIAVRQYPEDASFHMYRGEVLLRQSNFNQALTCFAVALKLQPSNARILASIGGALYMMKRNSEAKEFFQAANLLDPTLVIAASNLVHTSLTESDWGFYSNIDQMIKVLASDPVEGSPFNLLALVDDAALQKKRLAERDRLLRKTVVANKHFKRKKVKERRIRLGYFSCDFFDHATMFLLGQAFARHDRDRFEVFVYDYGPDKGCAEQQLVRKAADTYRQVNKLSDEGLAKLAREDGIDIAIDLKGHTNGNRLPVFAFRAAPVQVSYLGFPGTTGMKDMDYFVADPVSIPTDQRQHFSEKILYMPDSYQINDNTRPHPETVPTRAELGLPEEAFVFCSLNNPNKVTPAEFDVWMQLLHEVPDSVFWLLAPDQNLRDNLLKEAQARGIGPDRIVFAGRVSPSQHLARLPQADLFLDAFNCNAHTTASEALWSGVPLVTKMGKQFAARVAASVLTAVGCQDLITETVEDYHDLALKLAQDRAALDAIRARLKGNITTTPLYDTETFVKNFEDLMEKAIQRYDAGLKPKHISLG
ncbi:putative PEP-CTERM system TPR-repeat lipoprotein [Phaeobacter sp. CECT 5382]|nr:putative PEP-CTERM system TPR-repeat lipoprotein [Phaeobacter sp. CECT 5382]